MGFGENAGNDSLFAMRRTRAVYGKNRNAFYLAVFHHSDDSDQRQEQNDRMPELQSAISNRINMQWQDGEFIISTDRKRLQIDAIHRFLIEESYWAKERSREQTETAIKNSLPFGVYKGEDLVGFARVVTDYATFAYLGDVFITEEFRGRGLSKRLIETIVSHPELQNLRRWILATRDAHALYEKYDFAALRFPERWMEKTAPSAY